MKKWAVTIALIITFPIWFLPVAAGLMVWGIYDAMWGERYPYD